LARLLEKFEPFVGRPLVADPGLDERVTLRVDETPWSDALSALRAMFDLGFVAREDRVRVARRRTLLDEKIALDRLSPLGSVAPVPQNGFTGAPLDLDVRDVELRDGLRLFADISGLEIDLYPAVEGRLSFRVADRPWDQVFDAVLKAHRLGYVLQDARVT